MKITEDDRGFLERGMDEYVSGPDTGEVAQVIGIGIGLVTGALSVLGVMPALTVFLLGAGLSMLAAGFLGVWANDFRRDGMAGDFLKHAAAALFGFSAGHLISSLALVPGMSILQNAPPCLPQPDVLLGMFGVFASGMLGLSSPQRTVFSPNYEADPRCESFRPLTRLMFDRMPDL